MPASVGLIFITPHPLLAHNGGGADSRSAFGTAHGLRCASSRGRGWSAAEGIKLE
jgi:hypothetical protein